MLPSRLAAPCAAVALSLVTLGSPAYAATPDTSITSGPEDGALVLPGPVQFTFASTEPGATFACSVDNGPFTPCTSPVSYDLAKGGHVFKVFANLGMDLDPTPAQRSWTVRNILCEQAGAAYRAAQGEFFRQESKLGKWKTKLQRAKEHDNVQRIHKAKRKIKQIREARDAAQAAMDAAIAQEQAVC